MRNLLILILLSAWLAACNQSGDTPQGPSLLQAQATVASEVDRGETPVVVFQRATDESGALQEWRIYAGGRAAIIELPPGGEAQSEEVQLDAGAPSALLRALESAGFYEAADPGEQAWNENLGYVISTQRDGEWHSLAVEAITPQTSPVRVQSVGAMERFIFEQIGE